MGIGRVVQRVRLQEGDGRAVVHGASAKPPGMMHLVSANILCGRHGLRGGEGEGYAAGVMSQPGQG